MWRWVKVMAMSALVASLAACGSSGSNNGGGGGGGGGGGTGGSRVISGVVTSSFTGNAISGATVTAVSGTFSKSTTTDASGTYTLSGLPNTGTITISATASGFQNIGKSVTDTATTTVNLAATPTSGGGVDVGQPPAPPVFN